MTPPRHIARASRLKYRPTVDRLEGRALLATAGAIDTTFGAGSGAYLFPATAYGGTTAGLGNLQQVQVESGGSIVAAGQIYGVSSPTIGVIRLNADGSRDLSFGTDGVAEVADPGGGPGGAAFLLFAQSNGQILVFGEASNTSTDPAFVARLNSDGTPDTTFGTDGVVTLNQATLGISGAFFNHAALQSDDQLVIAGYSPIPSSSTSTDQVTVVRLTTTGALDSTFGTDGVVNIPGDSTSSPPNDAAENVAIQPNGQIVIAAVLAEPLGGGSSSPYTPQLIRLNADGSQDTTLGQAGIVASGLEVPFNLTVEPDGNIVVFGTTNIESTNPLGFASGITLVSPTGTLLKAASGAAGVADAPETAQVVAAPDGDVVVTGVGGFSVFRLAPDLAPDTTFGDDNTGYSGINVPVPPLPTGVTRGSENAEALAVGPDGQIVLVGGIALDGTNPNPPGYLAVTQLTATATPATPGDFTGDGVSDPAVYLSGTAYFVIGNSLGGAGQVVQLGTPGVGNTIPAPGDYYGTGQDDIAVYLADSGYWAIQDPTGQTPGVLFHFGIAGVGQTLPAPGDYFGTGQTDVADYFAASATWNILEPGLKPGLTFPFGQPGVGNTIPVPGDYFGTGADDVAVYLPKTGVWSILEPGLKSAVTVNFGIPGAGNSIPVPGDYDGSGHTELAVYIPALAELQYISARNTVVTVPFGLSGAGQTLPEPGDYDGSGKTEIAAYFPSSNEFVYRPADGGPDVGFNIGFPDQGPTLPVTAVVPTALVGSGSGAPSVSASAIGEPGVMGEADALDFLIPIASDAKKKAAGS